MLTTFNEVDMSAMMALRTRRKEAFRKRHGVSLGLSSFFVKAVTRPSESSILACTARRRAHPRD